MNEEELIFSIPSARRNIVSRTHDGIARWLASISVPQSVLLAPFLSKQTSSHSGFAQRIKNYFSYYLRSGVIPQSKRYQIGAALYVINFLDGAGLITDDLWPLAFTGLLTHDLTVFFTEPQERYGNTWQKILLGASDNQLTIGTHLANDLPTEWQYWVYPGVIAATAVLSGLRHVLSRRQWLKELQASSFSHFNQSQDTNDFSLNNFQGNQKNLAWDEIATRMKLGNITGFYLAQMVFAICHDGRLELRDKEALLSHITEMAGSKGILGYRILRALAEIGQMADQTRVARYVPLAQTENIQDEESDGQAYFPQTSLMPQGNDRERLQNLIHKARQKLAETARWKNSASMAQYFYAQYQLWAIGEGSQGNRFIQPAFWAVTLYLLYAKIRLWQLLAVKIIGMVEYIVNLKACEAQHKHYVYLEQIGNYLCTICGDWPVYIGDVDNSQGCINWLLGEMRSVDFLLEKFPRVLQHPAEIKTLDLTRQDWLNWPEEKWRAVLQNIGKAVRQLENFNLSLPTENNDLIDDLKIEDLAIFLKQSEVIMLDLQNIGTGSQLMLPLLQSLQYQNITYLNLSGNDLAGSNSFNITVQNLPLSVNTLKLAGNHINRHDLDFAALYLRHQKNLVALDLGDNDLMADSMDSLAALFDHNNGLQKLRLSGNNFSGANFTVVWQAIMTAPAFREIDFAHTQIGDEVITDLGENWLGKLSVMRWDFTDVGMTDWGAGIFAAAFRNSSVTHVRFSHNAITDIGVKVIADNLPNSPVISLWLDSIDATINGIKILSQTLINNANNSALINLEEMNLANNNMGDDAAQIFLQSIEDSSIRRVDMSGNAMTDASGKELGNVIFSSGITDLKLNNNKLGDATLESIAINLSNNTDIETLELQDNQIGSRGVIALSQKLSNSNLVKVNLQDNPVGDEGMSALAENLIKNVPNKDQLNSTDISLDLRRWIDKKAHRNTNLVELNIAETNMTEVSGHAICRALEKSRMGFPNVTLAPNSEVNPQALNLYNCLPYGDISAAKNPNSFFGKNLQQANNSQASSPGALSGFSALLFSPFFILLIAGSIFAGLLYLVYRLTPEDSREKYYGSRRERDGQGEDDNRKNRLCFRQ